MSEVMTRGIIGMPFEMAMSTDLSRLQFHARAQELLADVERLTGERAVMAGWIKEALLVLSACDADDCDETKLLRGLIKSGQRLVDGGADDLLGGS